MSTTSPPRPATTRAVLLLLVALGILIRIAQWLADGSLWLDEISIARNIVALPLAVLVTEPLYFDQVAPAGFLAAVKIATILFGESERVLWLVPLIGGIAALVFFRYLAERSLRGLAVPVAVALFAFGPCLIRYSAEVKQYGLDVAAAVGLTLLALDLRARDRSLRDLLLAGAAGLAIVFFSQASALVMAGLGGALAVAWLIDRDDRTRRVLLFTIPVWAVASVVALVQTERMMTPSTRAFMYDFWRGGFLPLPPRLSTAAPWSWERLVTLYGDQWTLRYPLPWLFALLALFGTWTLWRQRRDVALFVAAPFLVTVAAAIAQKYPFRQRLVVFLVPAALLAAAAAIGWIADRVATRSALATAAMVAAVLAAPAAALLRSTFPIRVDHYKPVYAHLEANRRPGDIVHVSFLANNSAIYYGPRFGLHRHEYFVGACNRNDTRAYLRDVDRFRGRPRVWFLWRTGPAYVVPHAALRRYLETIGVRRDALVVRSAVVTPLRLELYDLSDTTRLRAASAETFDVPPMPEYPKPGCRDWSDDERALRARVPAPEHPLRATGRG